MEKRHNCAKQQYTSSNQASAHAPDIVMVPLASLALVQEQLDKLSQAMHHLSIRAVPVSMYPELEEEVELQQQNYNESNQEAKQKIALPSLQKHSKPSTKELMGNTKWQLYYHGKSQREIAIKLLVTGLKESIHERAFEPQDVIIMQELEDPATPWCCFRLEFETRRMLLFKRIMRDIVLASKNASVTTI